MVTIDHVFGWRTQSEVLTIKRRQLDLGDGEYGSIRLDRGTTKNDEGRIAYLTPQLKSMLVALVERVKTLEKKLGRIVPWLFPHLSGRLAGTRKVDFRKA